MRSFGTITVVALVIACASTSPPSPAPSPPSMTPAVPETAEPDAPDDPAAERATPWSIVYADGSGNVSRFHRPSAEAPIEFAYDPVTPAESGSGTYSGGPPRSERVASDDARVEELWREVERLEADPAVQTGARSKGTGAVRISTPLGERAFIVEGGAALEPIERIVAGFGAP